MRNFKNSVNNKNTRRPAARFILFSLMFLIMFSLLTATACDADTNPGPTVTDPTRPLLPPGRLEPGETDHVALIMAGSIKDEYGKNSYQGLQLISAANAKTRYVENVPVSAAKKIAERLIRAEYNVIFLDSAIFSEVALDLAAENPAVMFFVVEGFTERENLINISFRVEEHSFLLGAVASVLVQDEAIGFVGKYSESNEEPWIEAFEAGAKFVNPTAEVHSFFLNSKQTDISVQTEQLINTYEPAILAVMAGDASMSAVCAAREAGLRIVSAVPDIKLLNPAVSEATVPAETDPDADVPATDSEEETETTQEVTAPTANTVPSWSPGATRSTISADDPDLYDPAAVKVLLHKADAYLYVYELFRDESLPAGTVYCGVKEKLITVEDFSADISADQIASINNVVDTIAQGDISIPGLK